MSANIDAYEKDVIEKGDEGSGLLAAICVPTLRNNGFVEVIKGREGLLPVLRAPSDCYIAVHSASGTPDLRNLEEYGRSSFHHLTEQAENIGAETVAVANVIDSNSGEIEMLQCIGDSMVDEANKRGLAIIRGENAILGARINPEYQANISLTAISLLPKSKAASFGIKEGVPTTVIFMGCAYVIFDPQERAVFINSDGVGTKTEFYERAGKYSSALFDSLAMKIDDAIKVGARVMAVSDVVEMNGEIPFKQIREMAFGISNDMDLEYVLQPEDVGERIMGYKPGVPCYNISGSVVSVIDEERLRTPLEPHAGEYLVVIRGIPNPRSNGITDKRRVMVEHFGIDWHETPEGKEWLEYLTTPSVVLYPVFSELIDNGLATSVYHMTGGAYKGKLAKPLAKHRLFVEIKELFPPHEMDRRFVELSGSTIENAYIKWPMGNDGFITTPNPRLAIETIEKFGLEAKIVGEVVKDSEGRTGAQINTPFGETLYFNGRE